MAFKKIAVLVILMTMSVCCIVAKEDSPKAEVDPEEEVKCTEEEVKAMNFLNGVFQKSEK